MKTTTGIKYLTLVKERVTKTRQGEKPRSGRHGMPKLSEIRENPARCPVRAFEALTKHRPLEFRGDDSPLFLTPTTNSAVNKYNDTVRWFKKQRCIY